MFTGLVMHMLCVTIYRFALGGYVMESGRRPVHSQMLHRPVRRRNHGESVAIDGQYALSDMNLTCVHPYPGVLVEMEVVGGDMYGGLA